MKNTLLPLTALAVAAVALAACSTVPITGRSRLISDLLGFGEKKNHAALPEEPDDDAAQQQKDKQP